MSDQTIKATVNMDDESQEVVEVVYDFGDNLEEAADKFGEKVVFDRFVAASTVTLQGAIRRYKKAGKSDEEIQTIVSGWKPGETLKAVAVDPLVALKRKLATMSDEEKEATLKELLA